MSGPFRKTLVQPYGFGRPFGGGFRRDRLLWLPCTPSADGVLNTTPYIARGASAPVVQSRNCAAYADVATPAGVVSYVATSANQMLCCRRVDANGRLFTGYHSQLAATNKHPYSTTSEGNWIKGDAQDTTTAVAGPFGAGTAEGWVADNSNNSHERRIQVTMTNAVHTYWAIAKAGTVNYVGLRDLTSGQGRYFSLVDGTAGGTIGGNPTSWSEDLGNGWWLIAISYTADASANNCYIYPSETGAGATFLGDAVNPAISFAHAQVELGARTTSPIISDAGGTVTRLKSQLRLAGAQNFAEGRGAVSFNVLVPAYTPTGECHFLNINDGAAAADMIDIYMNTNGTVSVDVRATGGTAGDANSTATINDNIVHRIDVEWIDSRLALYVDGALEAVDSSVSIPDALDRCEIGMDEAAGGQASSLIGDIMAYTLPGRRLAA